QLKVEKEGYEYPSRKKQPIFVVKDIKYRHPYFGEKFSVLKEAEIVNADVPLDKSN
ncbi:MAG: hypothetical protein HY602_02935, partial [Parcubacteria group bacterium]|nr:hypothetical protein [Parcubacteria group bacterium]